MSGEFERIRATAAFLGERGASPSALVVLGTGLGGLSKHLDGTTEIPYPEIPHFPASTSPGHSGHLVLGRRGGRQAMVMEGRSHFYEGYPMGDVTLPVRVARALGADTLLITSAVGGLDPHLRLGDVVVVEDHLNLMGDTPLRGPNDERLGPRFPDMSAPYDAALMDRAEAIALRQGFRLPRAVLAAVCGPQLETRAEYRYLRTVGADVVGMSTVPEVIVAAHAGMRACALSVVTDLCFPDALEPVDIDRILSTAAAAAPKLESLILGLLDDA